MPLPPGWRHTFETEEKNRRVGRYWTKLYVKSKPWAEIRDESCLRPGCHEKRLLEGQVQFHKVVFDHKVHLTDTKRGKKLQCTSCHSQIVQGEHITVTESSCFICHFKKSKHYPRIDDCNHCHKKEALVSKDTARFNHAPVSDNGFSCDKCHSNTIIGDGSVPHENCYKCHWEQERLDKIEDTDLMHTTHIAQHKIECNQCHMEIQHRIVRDIDALADCRSCHTDFHKAQKILYTGEGGKGVIHPMPNVMLEKGLSCKGCHVFHEESGGALIKSDTYVSEAKTCESCHGKGFSRLLEEWQTSTDKKVRKARNIYARARREITRSHPPAKEKARHLLQDALFNIEIVERGKSVHNVAFTQELLRSAYELMTKALETAGSSYRPPSQPAPRSVVPTECSNCHAGIEEINTRIYGLDFPHKKHLVAQKMTCSTCHSNARKHGELVAAKTTCASCHHRDTSQDCGRCHRTQKTLYRGGTLAGMAWTAMPDPTTGSPVPEKSVVLRATTRSMGRCSRSGGHQSKNSSTLFQLPWKKKNTAP